METTNVRKNPFQEKVEGMEIENQGQGRKGEEI